MTISEGVSKKGWHDGNRKHGMSGTRVHSVWSSMKQRCLNPRSRAYTDYGGRGIAVCERWLKFENFFADLGECPAGLTLGRIDNEKGYSPDNCRGETYIQQNRNTRLTPRRESYAAVIIRTHGPVKLVRNRKQAKKFRSASIETSVQSLCNRRRNEHDA